MINDDTETSQQFAPWQERARAQGYRSSAATPLRVQGRIAGTLNVYATEPHAFGPDKVMLLEKLAADLGVAIDHRAALATLRDSEERIRLLLDSSSEAIFGVDTQGCCTFVNPACLDMLGYTQAEMLGKSMRRLIHRAYPDGRPYPKEACHVRCSTLEGKPTHVDNEVHWRKDGTRFPVEYWSHPMYRNGELVGAVVNFVDISERKQMEQALRLSEERYRLISSVSTDLLYSCLHTAEAFFKIDWASAPADRIFGYSLDEILAQGCWRCYVLPDDLPEFDRNITHLAGTAQRMRTARSGQGRFHTLYPGLFDGGGKGKWSSPPVWRLPGHHRPQARRGSTTRERSAFPRDGGTLCRLDLGDGYPRQTYLQQPARRRQPGLYGRRISGAGSE